MFYRIINIARDKWPASDECTISSIIEYLIDEIGMMPDILISNATQEHILPVF